MSDHFSRPIKNPEDSQDFAAFWGEVRDSLLRLSHGHELQQLHEAQIAVIELFEQLRLDGEDERDLLAGR